MTISCLKYPVITQALAVVAVLFQLASCSTEDNFIGTNQLILTGICSETVVTINDDLTWNAPVAREDGTPLLLTELGGYRVYFGTVEGYYPNRVDIDCETGTLDGSLPTAAGTYYYVITAYDTDGRESTYSTVVTATI